jgi:ankyrin repeat protein
VQDGWSPLHIAATDGHKEMAALLMERRVVIVGQSRDVVSAAVAAANALLYPFK